MQPVLQVERVSSNLRHIRAGDHWLASRLVSDHWFLQGDPRETICLKLDWDGSDPSPCISRLTECAKPTAKSGTWKATKGGSLKLWRVSPPLGPLS